MDRSKTEAIVKNRRPGGGRKRKKPEYDADKAAKNRGRDEAEPHQGA